MLDKISSRCIYYEFVPGIEMELADALLYSLCKMRIDGRVETAEKLRLETELEELSVELKSAEERARMAEEGHHVRGRDLKVAREQLREARDLLKKALVVGDKYVEVAHYIMNMFRFLSEERYGERLPGGPQLDTVGWRDWSNGSVKELLRQIDGCEEDPMPVMREIREHLSRSGVVPPPSAAGCDDAKGLAPVELASDILHADVLRL